jgi:hypothetical protein
MTEENALTIYDFAPATNTEMTVALTGLKASLRSAAQANYDAIAGEDDYTETETMAMLKIEELRLVNGLDLAAVLLRAEYLQEIENNNLITRHPAGYASLGEMAQDQGISLAELSQTLDLANVIFPYVRDVIGIAIPQLWEQIGKSNMRELVPVLKRIITGEEAGAATVNTAADIFLEDVIATFRAADDERADDGEAVQREAVEQLLLHGATLTNRHLRERIRPERTPVIEVTTITDNNDVIVLAAMDTDQWTMFMRKMGASVDPLPFIAPRNIAQRQREALQIPVLRKLIDIVNPGDADA